MSFQVIKTWKQSTDPDFEAKKNRVLELYGIVDGTTVDDAVIHRVVVRVIPQVVPVGI